MKNEPAANAKAATIEAAISAFRKELNIGISALKKAGQIYAKAIIQFPEEAEKRFHEAFPEVSESTWDKLRLVGNGDIHPSLLVMRDSVAAKIARFSRKRQDAILTDREAFVVYNDKLGSASRVSITKLTPKQFDIVVQKDGKVRTVEEQMQFAENNRSAKDTRRVLPYKIEGGSLKVIRPCTIGINELKRILTAITKEAKK